MKRWVSYFILSCSLITLAVGCRDKSTSANGATVNTATTPVEKRVVGGLQEPVSLVFLSKTVMLVAERSAGRIRWVENGRLRTTPFATVPVPKVSGYNEHGLLGLAVDPDYPSRPFVYAFHTNADVGGRPINQRVLRFTVRNGMGTDARIVVDNLPVSRGCCHDGGRIFFGPDNKLYVTLGDMMQEDMAQDYSALPGKVLRYNADGTVPDDNPFEIQQEAPSADEPDTPTAPAQRSPVYTIGHRNPFGIAADPATNSIYITENGPDHGDEINRLEAGDNYGWPEVSGYSTDARFHAPVWATGTKVIAPTGAVVYTGDVFPQYRGNLFFAAYLDGRLRRMIFSSPDSVKSILVIPQARDHAKLDVTMSPDGFLYYSSMDAIYRLQPE